MAPSIDLGTTVLAIQLAGYPCLPLPLDETPARRREAIIDDGEPGFSTRGNWGRTTVEGYAGDVRFALAGNGSNVATWTFGSITPGWYRVSVTYVPGPDRATDAQFQVLDTDGSPALMRLGDGSPANGIANVISVVGLKGLG
mgnify:CR=1 FL=1